MNKKYTKNVVRNQHLGRCLPKAPAQNFIKSEIGEKYKTRIHVHNYKDLEETLNEKYIQTH